MSDKIDLGNGEWAKLRDPADVTERHRRPLTKVQRLLAGSDVGAALIEWSENHPDEKLDEQEMAKILRPFLANDEMDLLESSNDRLIVALVEEWSFNTAVSVDAAQDLPGWAYDALRDACQPMLNKVLGNDEDESAVEDPNSNFSEPSD